MLCLLPTVALAHPMAPDLTVAQLRIHYHLIVLSLRGPSSEMLSYANVQAGDLVPGAANKKIIDKITKWLPSSFILEKDGKPLTPEVVDTDYQNYPVGPEYSLTINYATDKPAEHLRITSRFVHTIVSAGGVQFELRGDKETTHSSAPSPQNACCRQSDSGQAECAPG